VLESDEITNRVFIEAETVHRAQVLKDGRLINFKLTEPTMHEGETMVDKSVMLRPLADLILFKLVQTFNSTVSQVLEAKLLPEQLVNRNL
jgi:hypothetical protein